MEVTSKLMSVKIKNIFTHISSSTYITSYTYQFQNLVQTPPQTVMINMRFYYSLINMRIDDNKENNKKRERNKVKGTQIVEK